MFWDEKVKVVDIFFIFCFQRWVIFMVLSVGKASAEGNVVIFDFWDNINKFSADIDELFSIAFVCLVVSPEMGHRQMIIWIDVFVNVFVNL